MHLLSSENQREMRGGLRWFIAEALVPVASSLTMWLAIQPRLSTAWPN